MTFKQKLRQLKISQDKAVLKLASDWVKRNFQYKTEGNLREDIWIKSVQDMINKDGQGDCDDFAVFIYITCELFIKDDLRLAIVRHENGNLHMVCVYYGDDRKNPLIITSTGAINRQAMVTLEEAWSCGWWITHTFDSVNVWRHKKPRRRLT
jgi:hypothetical protein